MLRALKGFIQFQCSHIIRINRNITTFSRILTDILTVYIFTGLKSSKNNSLSTVFSFLKEPQNYKELHTAFNENKPKDCEFV